MLAALLLGALAPVLLSHGVGFAIRRYDAWRLRRLAVGRLVLTYDDGPSALATRRTLGLLREHGVRATFFLVGMRAQRQPELCQLLVDEGHEIASHGYRHINAWRIAPWRAMREVEESLAALGKWLSPSRLFRPPFGKITLLSWLAARRRGAALVTWTLDSGDCWEPHPDPQAIVQRLLRDRGGVVLFHCHGTEEPRVQYVLELTDRLLRVAREHGLEVCTCSELLRPGSRLPRDVREEREVA
jgi:peptidoglycan/xylan/chitin deacetylase (PgdA/CDA1 family)